MKMKKILLLLPFLTLACTSELELPADGADEVLIVNGSLCSADSVHVVRLVSSSASEGIILPPAAKVTLFVNDVAKAESTAPSDEKAYMKSRSYKLECRFSPGDELRLTVETALGKCEVEGTVPAAPKVIDVRQGEAVELTYDDYGNVETRSFTRVFLTLSDPAGERNAYRVKARAMAVHELKDGPEGIGLPVGYKTAPAPADLTVYNLLEPAMQLPWSTNNPVNDFNVFSDDTFDGQTYSLDLCLRGKSGTSGKHLLFFSPPSVGSYYRDGVYYSDLWCSHQWLDVELEAIPYDTWRYIMAEEYDSEGPVIPLVYEPTLFPSNVKGGLGYVNISSATISTIQLPDVYFDVDHYPGGYIK